MVNKGEEGRVNWELDQHTHTRDKAILLCSARTLQHSVITSLGKNVKSKYICVQKSICIGIYTYLGITESLCCMPETLKIKSVNREDRASAIGSKKLTTLN